MLFRVELCSIIVAEFPHNMVNKISSEYGSITLSFLTNTNWFPYAENSDTTITAAPQLVKPHFTEPIRSETQSQVCHLFHNNQNRAHKFIAYNYFFNQNDNLFVNRQNNTVEVDTLHYGTEEEIIQFFEIINQKLY